MAALQRVLLGAGVVSVLALEASGAQRAPVYESPVPVTTVEPAIPPMIVSGGMVVASVRVGPDGRPRAVTVLTPYPALTQPVVAAIRQWTFAPGTRDGDPIEATTVVAVQVKLVRDGPAPGQ
jgi:TonB family protein